MSKLNNHLGIFYKVKSCVSSVEQRYFEQRSFIAENFYTSTTIKSIIFPVD
jgi:hypothetical protein